MAWPSDVLEKQMLHIAAVLCHCVRKVDENGVEDKADRHKYCPKTPNTWCIRKVLWKEQNSKETG